MQGMIGWAVDMEPYIEKDDNELPAFEVRMPDGHTYKVFASGRTEGFADDKLYVIVNRIPNIVRSAVTTAAKPA